MFDQLRDRSRLGNAGDMAQFKLDARPPALGHEAFEIGIGRAVGRRDDTWVAISINCLML
ncbi:hypothetical protein [Paraburkholderia sp. BCC1885]|uniref:hypothetical protein n=1 Tax=Paraburkholderia sp. BCC1885 TaxID=2562669 RepID=UPI0011837E58|nr:hypothetical protein [Paraburkholderia sp. BCC1885]